MALASQMAGADGVLLEVHETPEKAASDGQQTLNFYEANNTFRKLRMMEEVKKKM
jgi:3-deoxy-7-phosphoheptulonate synthase